MTLEQRAAAFKALGDPTRLRIFDHLCGCAQEVAVEESGTARDVIGLTVGAICCHLNGEETGRSNVSFHLKELRTVGLITMERRGKHIICAHVPDALGALAQYFNDLEKNACQESDRGQSLAGCGR